MYEPLDRVQFDSKRLVLLVMKTAPLLLVLPIATNKPASAAITHCHSNNSNNSNHPDNNIVPAPVSFANVQFVNTVAVLYVFPVSVMPINAAPPNSVHATQISPHATDCQCECMQDMHRPGALVPPGA